jgi:hypothetical protein
MLNGLPERTKDAMEVELIFCCWYHKKEKAAISNLLAAFQSRTQARVFGVALPLPASSPASPPSPKEKESGRQCNQEGLG